MIGNRQGTLHVRHSRVCFFAIIGHHNDKEAVVLAMDSAGCSNISAVKASERLGGLVEPLSIISYI